MWDEFTGWLLSLGDRYGVDPLIYAVIYVGAAPFFFASVAWLVRRLRRHEPLALPLTSTAFFFSAPTLYVFVAGRNLPAWVYGVLIGLAVVGAVTTVRRIRARLGEQGSAVATASPSANDEAAEPRQQDHDESAPGQPPR